MRAATCSPPASCLYEMATGQLPFQGATVATIFEGLLTKQPLAPSQLKAGMPPELDHIIFKALEKDRETRYQGAAELRADLKRLQARAIRSQVDGRRHRPPPGAAERAGRQGGPCAPRRPARAGEGGRLSARRC